MAAKREEEFYLLKRDVKGMIIKRNVWMCLDSESNYYKKNIFEV